MGFYPNWAWSWPVNRRVLYNRASADPAGKPWDPDAAGHPVGRGGQQRGSATCPTTRRPPIPANPASPLPFIMTGEGTGRLFSNGVADGPFPEHYEPIESPIENPLHPAVSATPVGVPLRPARRPAQPVRHRRPTSRTSPRPTG